MRISDWSSDVCSSDRQPFADALGTLSRWEHLPRAITPSEGSLAILVARLLADEARRLRQRGEERLGSEADLTERIGVSRQVLRQAEIGRHTSELQSLMRISYAVFCLKKKIHKINATVHTEKRTNDQTNNRKHNT